MFVFHCTSGKNCTIESRLNGKSRIYATASFILKVLFHDVDFVMIIDNPMFHGVDISRTEIVVKIVRVCARLILNTMSFGQTEIVA